MIKLLQSKYFVNIFLSDICCFFLTTIVWFLLNLEHNVLTKLTFRPLKIPSVEHNTLPENGYSYLLVKTGDFFRPECVNRKKKSTIL